MSGYGELKRASHAYIGRNPCGCVMMICSDLGDKFTGKMVGDAIKNGQTIERVTFEDYQDRICKEPTFFKCPHRQRKQPSFLDQFDGRGGEDAN